jgi:hypothetical protein
LTAAATGATNYTWYRNGSQVQNSTSPNYTVSSTGNYTVAGYNASCSGTTSVAKNVQILDCNAVPGCDGLNLLQGTAPVDGAMGWSAAKNYCASNGARLPTPSELNCMCNHKSSLPGSYSNALRYWSNSNNPDGTYHAIQFDDCTYKYINANTSLNFRCVK